MVATRGDGKRREIMWRVVTGWKRAGRSSPIQTRFRREPSSDRQTKRGRSRLSGEHPYRQRTFARGRVARARPPRRATFVRLHSRSHRPRARSTPGDQGSVTECPTSRDARRVRCAHEAHARSLSVESHVEVDETDRIGGEEVGDSDAVFHRASIFLRGDRPHDAHADR